MTENDTIKAPDFSVWLRLKIQKIGELFDLKYTIGGGRDLVSQNVAPPLRTFTQLI